MTKLSNINNFNEANYFKELPFYNKPIEKPRIKRLKNIDFLAEQIKRLEGMQCRIKLK